MPTGVLDCGPAAAAGPRKGSDRILRRSVARKGKRVFSNEPSEYPWNREAGESRWSGRMATGIHMMSETPPGAGVAVRWAHAMNQVSCGWILVCNKEPDQSRRR